MIRVDNEKFEEWLNKEYEEARDKVFYSMSKTDSDFWSGRADALADVLIKLENEQG